LKALIISLGLFKDSGGPVKTIGKFREALDARLYCFADPKRIRHDPLANKHAQLVETSTLPVLRQFCYAPPLNRSDLEQAVEEASILSCHSFYRYHTAWTHSAFKKFKVPYWHVPHGSLDPYVLRSGRLTKQVFLGLCGRKYLSDASCTVFATLREKEKAESVFGPLPSEIIHWPVEIPKQTVSASQRSQFRSSHDIPETAKVILYFGRIHAMKRPLETIRVVAGLKNDQVYLVVIGPEEGVKASDCEKEAKRHNFKNLRVLGPLYDDEKLKAIGSCDLYVSLSHRENFNHCAAECLASGLPILLSSGNDLGPEVVEAGAGWHLSSDSEKDWAAGVESALATSTSDLWSMGQWGRSLVRDKFSFAGFNKRLKALEAKYGRP